jgi:TRAP-type C4-dicarboxylate transport system permease small subunit
VIGGQVERRVEMESAPAELRPAASPATALRPVHGALAAVDALTRLDGWLGAFCLLALTAFMIAGMTVRLLAAFIPWLPTDLPIAWEYSAYLMAATFTFGAAMTLRCGGHVRVRIVIGRLSEGPKRAVEIAVSLIAACFTLYFTWALLDFTLRSYGLGEKSIASDTPLWIPQAIVTFGVLLMSLQFVARTARALLGLPLEIPAFAPGDAEARR